MLNFLYKWLSKDYNHCELKKEYIYRECIIPYNVTKYNYSIKGNVYVRKTKHIYKYKNPFFKDVVKVQYSGIFHAMYTFSDGTTKEETHQLKPDYYKGDGEFLLNAVDPLTL